MDTFTCKCGVWFSLKGFKKKKIFLEVMRGIGPLGICLMDDWFYLRLRSLISSSFFVFFLERQRVMKKSVNRWSYDSLILGIIDTDTGTT